MALKKKTKVIGLDIGSRTIKVAEIGETKAGGSLKKFGMIDITPGLIEDGAVKNHEAVVDAIKQLWKTFKIKEQNVAISLGGYSIIVKTISVQSMAEDQLQETIHFEAEQYIPFDISDVNLDFQILGESDSNPNQMNVLLVAAKKEMVNDYVNLVQMAGLAPCIVDVDAFALQNIYELNYELEDDCVALIDIGANKSTLNIIKGGNSMLMRDVSMGCQQINSKIVTLVGCSIEEAEQLYHSEQKEKISTKDIVDIINGVSEEWSGEIRRALDFFYSTYPGDSIRKIVLSGGGANLKQFAQQLTQEASVEVEVINPFKNFSLDGGFDPSYLERVAPQASICMGLAMRRIDDK